MPFGDIGFSGYWDASANRIIGKAGPGLIDAPRQQVQLWRVAVAGATPLGGVTAWVVGDYAYFNGYEWDKLIGQGSLTAQVNAAVVALFPVALEAYFAQLGTVPPVAPGLWLDGSNVVRS